MENIPEEDDEKPFRHFINNQVGDDGDDDDGGDDDDDDDDDDDVGLIHLVEVQTKVGKPV